MMQLLVFFDRREEIEVNVTLTRRSSKLCNSFKQGKIKSITDWLSLNHPYTQQT